MITSINLTIANNSDSLINLTSNYLMDLSEFRDRAITPCRILVMAFKAMNLVPCFENQNYFSITLRNREDINLISGTLRKILSKKWSLFDHFIIRFSFDSFGYNENQINYHNVTIIFPLFYTLLFNILVRRVP